MTLTKSQILICDYCQKEIKGRNYHQIIIPDKHFCNPDCKKAYRYPKGSRSLIQGSDKNEQLLKQIQKLCEGKWLTTKEIREALNLPYEQISPALRLGFKRQCLVKNKTPEGLNRYSAERIYK